VTNCPLWIRASILRFDARIHCGHHLKLEVSCGRMRTSSGTACNVSAQDQQKNCTSQPCIPSLWICSTVRKNGAPVFQVLAKEAKFCETFLKIVRNYSADEKTITDSLVVFTSLMRCLKDERVKLVANINYDKDWASQYKSHKVRTHTCKPYIRDNLQSDNLLMKEELNELQQQQSIMSGQTDVRKEHINAMDRTATILKHWCTSTSQHT
jgi:hypothetical protein